MTLRAPEPGLRAILAPNPSPMTLHGTISHIVGEGDVALIDPGPADRAHFDAILGALSPGERISHIFVTHAHLDHSPLARPLSEATGAPVLAFGPASAGRSEVMQDLAARGMAGGGEGVDAAFAPDACLADGDRVTGTTWELEAIHTPGHFCNHLSFAWGGAVFTGDHVMGWASTLISPPDGDLSDYFRSLDRVEARKARIFYPAHGDPVHQTGARIAALREHRQTRSRQILEALAAAPATAEALTRAIYTDTPAALLPAARRNVFAHLVELTQQNRVRPQRALHPDAPFERI
ncbi:MAG: MBL fold metallo-hydrolase [Rhodobacteraceae bacterium]|nr:MBL fold metallo-hydrolase [Paracoccaceae bacterium]